MMPGLDSRDVWLPRYTSLGAGEMAERRKQKKRSQEVGEPTKEEKAVAKYLRFNCPTKSTTMMGHRVDYFIASKAVDCLLDSKWAKSKKGEEAVFTTRESVVDYCNRLLKKQFFHRALKVMKKKSEKEIKKEKGKNDSSKDEEKKSKKEVSKDEKSKKEKKKDSEKEETKKEKKDEAPGTPKKKKETKRKFKLEPHNDQLFLDGNEVYVWIYDPVHFKTFAMGLILVIAVIAATLFPLWPAEMRVGVYYLSVAAGCFVASILLLAVARCILFLLIWLLTGGRHHFWFLPNLTADVGFIDSFRPLYTHEYKGPKSDSKKIDEETDPQQQPQPEGDEGNEVEEEETKVETATAEEAAGNLVREQQSDTDSDRRDDDGSQHSSGNGNDFEMITREELEHPTDDEEEEEEEEEDDDEEAQPLHSKS
ncbi:translocation protein SEC62 isoform X1 [Chiloscyllium plagiosum]|uniref:translocation protein SEC62 isoform X1 n=1 Tax=Chiloscyllium plagiosum TaxID=36176 RepID=UPI001CB8791E|nr:translocation protein SEC62 isoform X1 [Chiloscyllium plagiosum]